MPRRRLLLQWSTRKATGIVKPEVRQDGEIDIARLTVLKETAYLHTCRLTQFNSPRCFKARAGRSSRSAGASVGRNLNAGTWETEEWVSGD